MIRRLLTVAVALSLVTWIGPAWAERIHPTLEQQLRALPPDGRVSVIVEMMTQGDTQAAAAATVGRQRAARARAMRDFLRDVAQRHQGPVRNFLQNERAGGRVDRVVPLWIFNGLAVRATPDVVRALAARPDVWQVRLDATIPLPTPIRSAESPGAVLSEWNIDQIRAPEVWALDPAYSGVGSVIGSFDTGVDVTHPDLASRYRGNDAISWFDPYGQHATPFDFEGHGTHTTGTAVGGDAGGTFIGVAPGAKWIAAKAWSDEGFGLVSAFHQIFEWFLAPGDDPANAPDVVNASWGFAEPGCINEFLADVQALRAAGIFVSFSAGNDGPDAGSARSPGTYAESFAAGATDVLDEIAFFSARGPSPCDGTVKPNVSAPGVDVFSAVPGGYAAFSGTSMAAPHVTGTVAVLRSIDPTLTVSQIESLIAQGAVDLGPGGPDDESGAGRLDLFTSAQILLGGANRPTVTVTATTGTAQELGTTPGILTVTRTGSTNDALTVHYTVSGTAVAGADYVALPGTVTIPAESTTATIVVTPLDDTDGELPETVVVSFGIDPAYIVGSPGRATVTIVSDEVPPDLVIALLSAPSAAGAGAEITVTDTTKNNGGGSAGSSTTSYYLSSDGAFDPGDILLGSRTVPALTMGVASTGSVTLTVPAGTTAGVYSVLVHADAGNVVVETDEENNVRGAVLQVGPDLVIASLNAPPTAAIGASFTVTETTRNQGAGSAGASTTAYYLSADSVLGPGDISLGSRSVPALASGASHSGPASLMVPAGTSAGSYYLLARADGAEVVGESVESNNLATLPIRVGADLMISAFSTPSAVGNGTPFTVTDTTTNQGTGVAGASTTSYYLSVDPALDGNDVLLGSRAIPALDSGTASSGSTTLTIPVGTASGGYFVLARADAGNVVSESLEGNNLASRIVHVGTDLVVGVLSAPTVAGAGVPFTVTDTTRNLGGGVAEASTTGFYLSSDSVLDAADILAGSRSVPALSVGASSTGSITVTIPAGSPAGTYYIIARADNDNVVTEITEGNNTRFSAVQIGSDLLVASLSAPANLGAGMPFAVTDTTRNQGGGPADPSLTAFYLSTNAVLDALDVPLGSRSVPAIGPGASNTGAVTITIPAGTPAGTYYLLARADAGDTITESSEANNVKAQVALIGADLVPTALTVPAAVGVGVAFAVTDTTRNQGGNPAEATMTAFYLSTNAVLDAADTALGGRAVPALGPGASHTGAVTVTIPAGTPAGSYYILARADAMDALAETVETNNVLARTVQVGADLIVAGLTVPAGVGVGVAFTVTDTTTNQGGSPVAASTTGFYLSTNPTLDGADIALGSRAVPTLAAGASHAGSTTLTIPATTPAGTYYLLARADAGDAITESVEANNVRVQVVQIGADLVVSALNLPATVGAGTPFSVTDTTRNQGGSSADATTTSFYLSTNSTFEAADTLLGSRVVPGLGPGGTHTGSTTVTIPASTPTGSYYLLARADAAEAIGEIAEGNNVSARQITIGADLFVSAATVTSTLGAGLPFSVSDTTRNQGTSPAAPSTTGFYLSVNTVLDGSDTPLGSRDVPGLDAGASHASTVTLTLPSGIAPGSYYVLIRADAQDAVSESVEANNVTVRPVQVGPDLVIPTLNAPGTVASGASFTLTDTIRNQGGGPAGASTTTFYLSANAFLEPGDVVLGSRVAPALDGGVSDTGTVTLTVSAGTPPGTYYLMGRADSDGAVAESQETNNLFLRVIQVTAGN
jgi:subtilase family serine protease/subtilisin family serine protease